MFKGHPKGLFVLFFSNMGERFGYYTMLAIFTLYLRENFGWDQETAASVYGWFLAAIYFLPLFGGLLADKVLGYGKTITIGLVIMGIGYFMLALPTTNPMLMIGSLAVIACGVGLFKGNLVVLVGNLYDNSQKSHLRDAAFNIFYMGINVGALFAPYAANGIKKYMMTNYNYTLSQGYNAGFLIAGLSMLLSIIIFLSFRKHYKSVDTIHKNKTKNSNEIELTPAQVKDRIVALFLVFIIVIFFWMAFHQNGSTLTFFAKDYTQNEVNKFTYMLFDIKSLVPAFAIIVSIILLFSKGIASKIKLGISFIALAAISFLVYHVTNLPANNNKVDAELFQAFNPMFIVFLTPVVVGIFAYLNRKKKEPTSPAKIGIGMLITSVAFVIMVFAAQSMPSVNLLKANPMLDFARVTPYYLISTYLVLTVAELFLSPMGLSFVSKVAPPKLKGIMQGGWLGATAIGNYLAGYIGRFYQNWELWQFFLLLVIVSLLSALIMFAIMKKITRASVS